MSFRTVTKPHMKKTVVTTVRARPVFWGAVPVAVLVVGRFMGSRASITDFADPGTGLSIPRAALGRVDTTLSPRTPDPIRLRMVQGGAGFSLSIRAQLGRPLSIIETAT